MTAAATVGRRFTQLIQHLGISKNAFALSLDKTATVIQHLVDERNKPGYDLLCKVFEVYPQVSKDWLLLGQGPMLITASASAATTVPNSALEPAAAAPAQHSVEATPETASTQDVSAPDTLARPSVAAVAAPGPTAPVRPAPETTGTGNTEALLTAALHAQHLQHQLALAEQRNQHLLEQQRLMQQLLDLAQRR